MTMYKMKVIHRGIEHERSQDAPFIGALIIADTCSLNCEHCFNSHLREVDSISQDANDIITEVKSNPFNKGIILSGLEWTDNERDMWDLVHAAREQGLQIMIHTGRSQEWWEQRYDPSSYAGCYVKFGQYDPNQVCSSNVQYGVKLATANQKIIKY